MPEVSPRNKINCVNVMYVMPNFIQKQCHIIDFPKLKFFIYLKNYLFHLKLQVDVFV